MNSIQFNSTTTLIRGFILLLLICLNQVTLAQEGRYNFSADGAEVTDLKTGLIWKRCSEGQRWNGITCAGSPTLAKHEVALGVTKPSSDWRLPNVKELSSLVDTRLLSPAIYPKAFPNTSSNRYWTSTAYAADPTHAWTVDFENGNILKLERKNTTMFRLVR